jgi:hypothetical protein
MNTVNCALRTRIRREMFYFLPFLFSYIVSVGKFETRLPLAHPADLLFDFERGAENISHRALPMRYDGHSFNWAVITLLLEREKLDLHSCSLRVALPKWAESITRSKIIMNHSSRRWMNKKWTILISLSVISSIYCIRHKESTFIVRPISYNSKPFFSIQLCSSVLGRVKSTQKPMMQQSDTFCEQSVACDR